MLLSSAAVEALAVVLVMAAGAASRIDEELHVEGKTGSIQDLLDRVSTSGREFTSAGIAMLTLATVAALAGGVLLVEAFRRR